MFRWGYFVCIILGQVCCMAAAPNVVMGQQTPGFGSRSDTMVILHMTTQGNAMLTRNPAQALQLGRKADSLAAKLDFSKGRGESQLLIAAALKQLEKVNEAIPFLEQAEANFTKAQYANGLLRTYRLRASVEPGLSRSAAYYEKALSLMKAAGDKRNIPAVLTEASLVKMQEAQLPVAEEMLNESIRLAKEAGIENIQWQYSLLGAVQLQKRENVNALKNELLAVKIGEQYRDTSSQMSEIYNFTGLVYSRMGKPDDALVYFRKAIATGSSLRNAALNVQLYSNIAGLLIRQNKPQEALSYLLTLEKQYGKKLELNARIQLLSRTLSCYTALDDMEKARPYAEELMNLSDNMKPDEYNQLPIFMELNRYLTRSGQFDKARHYVEKQKVVAEKFRIFEQLNQYYYYKFKIDSAAGDPAAALKNYQLYIKGKDSVYNENNLAKLNQLHVEYETGKKDKELELKERNIQLLAQEASLQKALSDKRAQELILNNQALALRQKDLLTEKQRVQLLTKHAELQEAESEKQKQGLIIQQKNIGLLKQNNQLQQSDLQRTRIMRNVIIAGIILMTLFSLLLYGRYRIKKRASEILEQQREEIRLKNFSLQALLADKDKLLKEKEWLVKEVHHRVKNNLQMVMSLLNSQSVYLANEDALAAISESQRRMQAIALIHQKLYEKEASTINMQAYIAQLVDYLKDSFNNNLIRFSLQLDPLELDVTRAVPAGLILNEAITNALKYAFPGDIPGNISISLQVEATSVELTIADDGVGLPGNFAGTGNGSLGISLMEGLSAQLKGTCQIISDKGVAVMIRFRTDDAAAAILNGNFANTAIENAL